MASASRSTRSPFRRLLALVLCLTMLGSAALSEGEIAEFVEQPVDPAADPAEEQAIEPAAEQSLLDAALSADPAVSTDPAVAAQPDAGLVQGDYINMDADLRLGYVAAAGVEMNPFLCTERDLVSLNQLVYESVVELDETLKPVPLLADSWQKQGDTWIFTLRSGIVFHNGAPLTADEVVNSYQRFSEAGEDNPYYSRVALIKSMNALDELRLQVTFRISGYAALYAMTFPVVERLTLGDSVPRGTGPYWITEYQASIGVRLEANPLWWKKDPEIQSVAALNYASAGDALEALRTDEIDIFCTQSSKAAVNRKLSDLTSMDYQTNNFEMLIPNLQETSPMGDIRLRQAVMYALDRASIAENAYLGMGVQCEVPVNPGSWLYETQSAIYYYSPERALQLLLECGWKDLTGDGMLNKINGVILQDLTVNIITYNESTNNIRENAADLVAAYLQEVGINATVTVYSRTRCLNEIRERDFDLALVGVQLSEVPNLAPLLQGGGSLNMNNFRNENMEVQLRLMSSAQSEEEMKSVYSQIQMLTVERLPVLGLLFRSGTVLSTRSLGGLSGLRVSNMLNGIEFMKKEVKSLR